jgi:hypothetical protein
MIGPPVGGDAYIPIAGVVQIELSEAPVHCIPICVTSCFCDCLDSHAGGGSSPGGTSKDSDVIKPRLRQASPESSSGVMGESSDSVVDTGLEVAELYMEGTLMMDWTSM